MPELTATQHAPADAGGSPFAAGRFVGAEAVLTRTEWDSLPAIRKDRIAKAYRLPELDARLRAQRTALEANLLRRAKRAGVPVPRVLEQSRHALILEFLPGPRLKDCLNNARPAQQRQMAASLGSALAQLHAAGISHGDFTTSNSIWLNGRAWLIDFGLGRATARPEDFATDLHVLREALQAAHPRALDRVWKAVLSAYRQLPSSAAVLAQLQKIERRRRYARAAEQLPAAYAAEDLLSASGRTHHADSPLQQHQSLMGGLRGIQEVNHGKTNRCKVRVSEARESGHHAARDFRSTERRSGHRQRCEL